MSDETKRDSMLVSDMLARGSVEAICRYCGNTWSAPIGFLPEPTTLEKVGQLLACPTCCRDDIDIEPEGSDPGGRPLT